MGRERSAKTQASCTQDGVAEHVCALCGAAEEKPIDATGHDYAEQNTDAQYLASEATCTSAAVYYYSCSCGEKGTDTFASGSEFGHNYKDGECDRCGEPEVKGPVYVREGNVIWFGSYPQSEVTDGGT